MIFRNRTDAALQLLPCLEKYKEEQGVVMAVPRGGVPIGYYISRRFNFPLELLMTKKIGHPSSEEFAIGAVSMEDQLVDDRHQLPEAYINKEVERIRQSLRERYKLFMGEHKPVELENKVVILVDDGIATGHTVHAAIRLLRKKKPKKIVLAVPVAPAHTAARLRPLVDELILLLTPDEFYGVGQFYEDFSEVTDDEVIALLRDANRMNHVA